MDIDLCNLGLSTKEAKEKLSTDGPNIILGSNKRNLWIIFIETFREPMYLLLIAASLIYLFIGNLKEGLSLLVFVNLILAIKLFQEGKTENALEALKNLASPRALVVRDGITKYISGVEVVKEDIIIIKEGDRIPADGRLLAVNNLQIDESLLTGESIPVNKSVSSIDNTVMPPPGGDNTPFVYSGTLVVSGQGIFQVMRIGAATEMGRIGVELQSIETEISPLQKQVNKLVKVLAVYGLLFCIGLIIIDGAMHGEWLKTTLLGIALLMSMIPEEFPVILTVFPALGAWRLSKKNVLTRRISAIETLGSTTVLCVDKTGTITQNTMKVAQLWANNVLHKVNFLESEVPDIFLNLINHAILASQIHPFDPMEKAFFELGNRCLNKAEYSHNHWKLIHEFPLTPGFPAMSHVWETDTNKKNTISAKGSPEAIMKLCQLDENTQSQIVSIVEKMASNGLRVLAVAKAEHSGVELPKSQQNIRFTFLGLLGLYDPLREGIPEAIQECHNAGIRVIMITGDYPSTAKAIAQQAGLSTSALITGDEINELDDNQLQNRIKAINICARITPNQKYRIVKALKADKNIVVMTGDGVNDAPALKSAHVSIAMGNRGTDVAREASTLVLLDDNFNSIVNAIRSGRRIYDNMQKSMSFILAIHVPIAGIALLTVLLNLPPVFYPLHIALIELLIDPTCSIAFENEPAESNLMKRQPRKPTETILNKDIIILALLQGLGILMITLSVYILSLNFMSESEARTFTFSALVISNLMLIFSNRSRKQSIIRLISIRNNVLFAIVIITLILLLVTVYMPFIANLLHFSPLPLNYLLLSFLCGLICIGWFEMLKYFFYLK
ncbi:MAG: cation-translocating P-type ATPase [Candidatus Berkiella sp.]